MARRKRRPSPAKNNRISPGWLWAGGVAVLIGIGLVFNAWLAPPAQPPLAPTLVTTPVAVAATLTPTPVAAQTPTLTPEPTLSPMPAVTITATRMLSVTAPPLALPPTVYTYTIVNVFPHDRGAFTQGLVHLDDIFYEGTGLYGRSTLRKVEVETGKVLQRLVLPADLFGEGITIFDDRLIQLTWKARQGFEYDKDTFELLRTFSYPTEGWGITHDGERLIMSDGTANLYFWNPISLEEIGRIQVVDDHGPVVHLNELEYVNGEVFANVWQTNRIARIDPDTGLVLGWIVLPDLLTAEDRGEPVDVLNGIAYNPDEDRLFVTGKLWPKIFEIALIEYE
jgi:glutamine cyclotransferase